MPNSAYQTAPAPGRSGRSPGSQDVIPIGGAGLMGPSRNLFLMPSSPLAELRKVLPNAQIDFDPGQTPARGGAARAALRRGHRLWDPRRGRELRPHRPVAAVG